MTPDLDLIALVKEGKVAVVPVEMTGAMADASRIARMNVIGGYDGPYPGPWEAALAASPTLTPALLALAEERDRLREALAPFAEAIGVSDGDTLGRLTADDKVVYVGSGSWSASKVVTVGDLRRAARAFNRETRHDG